MLFMIFVDACFGIVFRWLFALILVIILNISGMTFPVFWAIDVLMFWGIVVRDFLPENGTESAHRRSSRIRPLSLISLHTCESKLGKTHKCDLNCFPNFKVSLKVFLHTCESCRCKTYKYAVARKKKGLSWRGFEFSKFRGSIWEQLWLILASFWVSFVFVQDLWLFRIRSCVDFANLLRKLKIQL